MKKNKFQIITSVLIVFSVLEAANAQIETKKTDSTAVSPTKKQSSTTTPASNIVVPQNRKKVTINFEDELVEGQYDAPEVLLMNSRKHIKYKDLFNTRNNFLDEIETNRGMFNGQRKNK